MAYKTAPLKRVIAAAAAYFWRLPPNSGRGLAPAGTGAPAMALSIVAARPAEKPVPASATPTFATTQAVLPHEPSPAAWATERLPDGRYAGPLKPPQPPERAARELVDWLREVGEIGDHTPRRLLTLYCEHCELERRTPVPDNMLLGALKSVPGVVKLQAKGTTKDGKRHRPTRWVVESAPDVPEELAACRCGGSVRGAPSGHTARKKDAAGDGARTGKLDCPQTLPARDTAERCQALSHRTPPASPLSPPRMAHPGWRRLTLAARVPRYRISLSWMRPLRFDRGNMARPHQIHRSWPRLMRASATTAYVDKVDLGRAAPSRTEVA